jgi:AraC-like DNA-binding protein
MLTQKTIGCPCSDLANLGALDGCDGPADGFIWKICFAGKFSVENMDYRFGYLASKRYHEHRRFMEILCLDSIEAVHRNEEDGESKVRAGFSVNINRGRAGEIRFSANTAVRGVRIVVAEEFYSRKNFLDIGSLNVNPELRLALGQIKRSAEREVDAELYYESKITELLYWIGAEEGSRALPKAERELTREDMEAVGKVKSIIDGCVSNAPRIGELSALSGTSAAKLQNDFKTAYGTTIHGYVQKVRMTEALSKIENTDASLHAIAHDIGYRKPGRFSEIFKETYGMTPTEYRNLIKHRQN